MNLPDFHKAWKKHLPGVPCLIDAQMVMLDRKPHVDILKLNDWLVANKGHDDGPEMTKSLSDFIEETYSKAAADFIRENL